MTGIDQNEIEKVVRRLQERDGVCTPEAFVLVASDPASPLHAQFEWDDEVAGQRWRIHQARQLIGRVRIEVSDTRTPAHVHVTITRGDRRVEGYVPLEVAMSNEEMRGQVFAEARSGLRGWRNRLAAFDQAAVSVRLIDQAIEGLEQ